MRKLYEHTYAHIKHAVIDLTLSSNPCRASPHVAAAIKNYAENVHDYPDSAQLTAAIAEHHNVSVDNVLVGSGANQIIEDILKIYALNCGIITSSATFPEPIACITTLGGYAKSIPLLGDYNVDLNGLLNGVDNNVSMIYLCNPNNPTGLWLDPKKIIAMADSSSVPILLSEVGADFIGDSVINHKIHRNIIVVRSFSKAYGLAGMRIGYIVAEAKNIAYIKRRLGSYRTSSIAMQAALAALHDQEHLRASINYILNEKSYLMSEMYKLGFEAIPSQGQTFIAKVPPCFIDANGFCEYIAAHGVAVVNCSLYEGLERYIRISPQKHHINEQFILIITEIIKELL